MDPGWVDKVGPRKEGEEELLEGAVAEVKENSRLACQIKVTPALDGLRVYLPEEQL